MCENSARTSIFLAKLVTNMFNHPLVPE